MFKLFTGKKSPAAKSKEKNHKNSGYVNWWLFRTKGTVKEPWPTAEELLSDPEVQKDIAAVNRAFSQNTQSNK